MEREIGVKKDEVREDAEPKVDMHEGTREKRVPERVEEPRASSDELRREEEIVRLRDMRSEKRVERGEEERGFAKTLEYERGRARAWRLSSGELGTGLVRERNDREQRDRER
ncbi:hypothetical protein Tco_0415858 [Tanacetum coccineum]